MAVATRTGSSPRKRGTVSDRVEWRAFGRFIPAQAGNSPWSRKTAGGPSVHPRASGEQGRVVECCRCKTGSSPRKRGTGMPRLLRKLKVRFIPAQAGNSRGARGEGHRSAVHPRASGEQGVMNAKFVVASGSSPRKRGTVRAANLPDLDRRFIPAQAGNSAGSGRTAACTAVHPRASGEQSELRSLRRSSRGSSPRKRGTGAEVVFGAEPPRFIPAQAGNRWSRHQARSLPPVHPRASGEQILARAGPPSPAGSSPRKRGTVEEVLEQREPWRFIPAQAGNSLAGRH